MTKGSKRKARASQDDPPSSGTRSRTSRRSFRESSASSISSSRTEHQEDPGMTESQHFMTLSKALKKPKIDKGYIMKFKQRVEEDRERLEQLLGEKERGVTEFEKELKMALATHVKAALEDMVQDRQSTANTLLRDARRLVDASKALRTTFEAAEPLIDNVSPPGTERMAQEWQADKEKVTRLLEVGEKGALRKIRKTLGLHTADVGEKNEDDQEEMRLFKNLSRFPRGMTVGDTLGYAERGIKRVVKGLPADGDA